MLLELIMSKGSHLGTLEESDNGSQSRPTAQCMARWPWLSVSDIWRRQISNLAIARITKHRMQDEEPQLSSVLRPKAGLFKIDHLNGYTQSDWVKHEKKRKYARLEVWSWEEMAANGEAVASSYQTNVSYKAGHCSNNLLHDLLILIFLLLSLMKLFLFPSTIIQYE